MFLPSEDLLERLRDVQNATYSDALAYLGAYRDSLPVNSNVPLPEHWMTERDLANFKMAFAWWPTEEVHPDIATTAMRPTLITMLSLYDLEPSFEERLRVRTDNVVKWLNAKGISLSNPNETRDQRKSRKNREAQARHRERGKDGATAEHARKLAEAWDAYMALCAERRAADDVYKERVKAALADYQALKQNPPSES